MITATQAEAYSDDGPPAGVGGSAGGVASRPSRVCGAGLPAEAVGASPRGMVEAKAKKLQTVYMHDNSIMVLLVRGNLLELD